MDRKIADTLVDFPVIGQRNYNATQTWGVDRSILKWKKRLAEDPLNGNGQEPPKTNQDSSNQDSSKDPSNQNPSNKGSYSQSSSDQNASSSQNPISQGSSQQDSSKPGKPSKKPRHSK
jgi:hypothetical protein